MAKEKVFKPYKIWFYRKAERDEIGPQAESITRACTSKTDAIKTGKTHAKGLGWRFLHVEMIEDSEGA